jgi:hypothetical protein
VLSLHLEGAACRVGCEFCYLGARSDGGDGLAPLDLDLVEAALGRLEFEEVAVAVSEPAAPPGMAGTRAALERLSRAVRARGRRFTVTTTAAVAASALSDQQGLLGGVDRLNLSVDPEKGTVDPGRIGRLAARLRPSEIVLVVSLTSPQFAARLVEGGLLEALVDLPAVDKVALNALKPPPPWCDHAFFLRALSRLRPLLARALDRRLFLDCWVAARLLQLGGCPARPDLSPAPRGVQFRSCVYQAAPDFVAADAEELAARLADFRAPAQCPFPYDKISS